MINHTKTQVGKGQFSEVYKARLHIDNSIVALKKVQVKLQDNLIFS